ncbi:MAG: substrate-binding domain-containing protein [Propionicimonas sp.]
MKIYRVPAAVAAACAVVIGLSGCSVDGPGSPSSAAPSGSTPAGPALPESCAAEKPVVGVALPNTVNPYYISMKASFEENGAALGFDVKVAIANDDDSAQLGQVQSFIQQKVCAVVLNGVNSGPAAASVAALNQAGIPVFTVNQIVDPDSLKAQSADFVQFVGADQTAGGTAMGELAIKDIGTDTPLVVGLVGAPDQIAANQRDKGFVDALTPAKSVEVLPTVNSKVDPAVALQVTSELLQSNPAINVIFAATGPSAVGAIQAINQTGRADQVRLYAFCAAETKLDDFYVGCAAQEPAVYADTALKNLKSYLGGEQVEHEVLLVPKVFTSGQTPAPGELG